MIFEHFIKENKKEFLQAVADTAAYLKVPCNDLMFLMWFETARTLDHRKVNFQKGDDPNPERRCMKRATGLIQFMPKTAVWLGTTNLSLYKGTNVEQMEYVKMHLSPFRGRYVDYLDLYCGIFWPAAVGKPDTYRITSDVVARQNPIFDVNKDLDIEKAEIRKVLRNMIPKEYRSLFAH